MYGGISVGARGIHDIQTCYTPPLPASIITQHQTPMEQLHVNTTKLGFKQTSPKVWYLNGHIRQMKVRINRLLAILVSSF